MFSLAIGTATAVLILVCIHFFGLRLQKKLQFPHMQFLTSLISKTKSIRKLQNYLLLFIRGVFIATALTAFLLVVFQKNNTPRLTGKASIFIDSSWSMQSSYIAKENSNAGNVLAKIKDASNPTLTLQSSLFSLASDLLASIDNSNSRHPVYVFSDFQKSTFPEAFFKEFPNEQPITLVSFKGNEVPNIYIDSIWSDEPILLPRSHAGITVRVSSSLLKESRNINVTAYIGKKLVGTTQLLVEQGQKPLGHFNIPFSSDVAQGVRFSVEDTENTFDNNYYAVVEPLATNIKLDQTLMGKHPVALAYQAEKAFSFINRSEVDSKFWVLELSASRISSSLIKDVKDWMADGGSILIFPVLGAQKATIELLSKIELPGIREESSEVSSKLLKQPDFSDTFFRQVFEKKVKNMEMPQAKPLLRWNSASHTILRFTDNTPFLSTFKVKKGKIHLFSSPINSTSSFVSHPLFVPVLYQLALSGNDSKSLLSHELEKDVIIPLKKTRSSKQPYKLVRDGRVFIPEQKVVQEQLIMSLPKELNQPGLYNVEHGGQIISRIALNIPRTESELVSYTPTELEELLLKYTKNVKVLEFSANRSLEKQLLTKPSGANSLWKYCLILCFLCLVGEAYILSMKKRGTLI